MDGDDEHDHDHDNAAAVDRNHVEKPSTQWYHHIPVDEHEAWKRMQRFDDNNSDSVKKKM
jgi:hypothetical protein